MSTFRKLFTLEEANRTLPYVSKVIDDIVETNQVVSDFYAEARRLAEEGRPEAARPIEDRIRELLENLEDYIGELEQVGCEFKGYELGLVDFPAQLGDRIVYLCWRRGESEIQYWHELNAGFPGRKPVDGSFTARSKI